jgi:PTS system nitrogen regulatory IIA component
MKLAYATAGKDNGPRPTSASPRQVAQWLLPQDIALDVDVWDRRRALEWAASRIGQANGLDPAPILRALSRREQVGSTALGQGIAIPHARIAGISRPLTLFMRPKMAMEFDAPDGKPVSNLLVIMVPADGDTEDHLHLLALVAEAFSDTAFRGKLSAASSAPEVASVFERWVAERQE